MTEPEYFERLAAHLRQTGVTVLGLDVVGEGPGPARVVKRAVKESDGGRLAGSRDGFDSVWCVFDVDEHKDLDRALKEAAKHGFEVAVSNPCFEIWLLWHCESHSANISRENLKRKLRKHGVKDKHIPARFPFGSLGDAIDRAKGRAASAVPDNPGSAVWILADQIRTRR